MHIGNTDRCLLLDQTKLIMAFFVILIHAPISGNVGWIIGTLNRSAVPFFLLVSGFYVYQNDLSKIKEKIWNLLKLLIWSVLIYFVWDVLMSTLHGTSVNWISLKQFFLDVIYFTGHSLGHLWYIVAVIYCYFFVLLFRNKITIQRSLTISIILIFGNFLIKFLFYINNFSNYALYTRNFIFTALPIFLFGYFLGAYSKEIKAYLSFVLMIGGMFLSLVEQSLFGVGELYIGSLLFAVGVFLFSKFSKCRPILCLARIGQRNTTDIYIIHVIIIGAFNIAANYLHLLDSSIYTYIRPILVLVVSILFSELKILIVQKSINRFEQRGEK